MNQPIEADSVNAKIAHEARLKSALSLHTSVITFAVEALKSAILINGGTAGALLAFVGQKGITANPGIGEAFYWFSGGLLSGALATGFSYIAQFSYAMAMDSYINTWVYPYLQNTRTRTIWISVAAVFHVVGVLGAAISYGAAVRGFWIAGKSLPF